MSPTASRSPPMAPTASVQQPPRITAVADGSTPRATAWRMVRVTRSTESDSTIPVVASRSGGSISTSRSPRSSARRAATSPSARSTAGMNVVPTVPPTLSMGTPMILTVMATVSAGMPIRGDSLAASMTAWTTSTGSSATGSIQFTTRSPRWCARSRGRARPSRRAWTEPGSRTSGAGGPTTRARGCGSATASPCRTRSPNRSWPCARSYWSTVVRSTWTRPCNGTGPDSPPPLRSGTCSPIRPASWRSMRPPRPRRSTTGTGCALCSPRSSPNGNREPRTASRRSSSAIWSASSFAALTADRRDGSFARRSADGWGWTSPSGSNRPSRRGRSS